MIKDRMGLGVLVVLASAGLFIGQSGCSSKGGGKNDVVSQCLACAEDKCPSQSQACDDLPACQALRSCELRCAKGDASCQNQCVNAAANDVNAIAAAANLIACASSPCASACNGSSSGNGTGGLTSTGQGGATSAGGRPSTGGQSATGGSSTSTGGTASAPLQCQDLLEWSAACVVSNDAPFRTCNAAPPSLCQTGCYLDATCDEYTEAKSGAMNGLWTCLKACELAGGGTATANCANARAKRLLCDRAVELACSDSDPVDQCLNKCVLTYPCDQWEPRMGGDPTAFQNCYNGCEASTGTSSPHFVVGEGGYVTTSSWHGYAWTATDGKSASTISPAEFSTLPAGRQLCVSGTVVGTADYSAAAMLGFNLSQAKAMPGMNAPAPVSWSPLDDLQIGGLNYSVTNRTATPLRIQIQGPNGATDPNQRWCNDITGQTGSMYWHSFNTQCWEGGAGSAYNGIDPLVSMMVLVPGDTVARTFDFCIYHLLED